MQAIRFSETGGPDVLRVVDVEPPAPGPGQILVRHAAMGVNFIDTYHRSGLYPVALPSGLGLEGAGVVEAVGPGVTRFRVGERAAYCTGPIGAYAEAHVVSADRAVRVPDPMPDDLAAAALLKGLTACYLLKNTFPVKPGHVAVIHAAAGGVGQIAVQWAKHLGATVIAVVGDAAKADIAKTLGADHVIMSRTDDIAAKVRGLTNGEGADVVYDSVGKDTFEASLKSLKPLGMFVSFGNASGPAPPVDPQALSLNGSLFFTRPTLFHYTRTTALLQEAADALFEVVDAGAVTIAAPARYRLADAAKAHRDLEGRRTTGSVILAP
jgi:NADPH2:quinone reductase